MNMDRLNAAAGEYATFRADSSLRDPFRSGALWHETEMMRQGLLIKLIGGPADGKVMPRPVIGEEITFRRTDKDGKVVDDTYVVGIAGVWVHKGGAT